MDTYSSYVSTVIYNIIGQNMTREDVEETASDVFFTLWNNTEKLIPEKLKPYLGSIARNKAKNKLREIGETVPLEEDYVFVEGQNSYEIIEERERADIIRGTLNELSSTDKEVFIRHYYCYQTISDIEDETGIPASTIKSKLKRGREKLKEIFNERGVFL